ncbi:hypothetical protein DZC72_04190 [Maribacter algicola]|uniref:Lipocalin-like domain-containing protein n=1 Tax=Maribacter algicola TaxID=2498892 RepID=A0A426RLB1_9FLAO|nr:hypothetical protein [Maribacter algicola]RRQ49797.1 hypothetical protein DZC72_04190 [Maribacter algicola]
MKTRNLISLITLLGLLTFSSCRTEDDLSIDPPSQEFIGSNTNIADLLNSTSLNDGSSDNIIDNASCFSLVLPVTVSANGQQVVVSSQSDFQTIENIFDSSLDDTDVLEIQYPISLMASNFETTVVNSLSELLSLTSVCPEENAIDDDIECIDFVYPIRASAFNENSELVETFNFDNDKDLFDFIKDIDEYSAATLLFPISLVLFDGTQISVSSLSELETVIENAEDVCDEDDDNDYDDDDCDSCSTDAIETIFSTCTSWTVDKLERNDNDLEDLYSSYSFAFMTNGEIEVNSAQGTTFGSWQATGSGNNMTLLIDIPGLVDFNDSWNIHEIQQNISEATLDLRMGEDRLRFESSCSGGETSGDVLSNTLTEPSSIWLVDTYLDDGADATAPYIAFEFTFNPNGSLTATNGSSTINGTWSSQNGGTELMLDFNSNDPLDEFNDSWDVISLTDNRLELSDTSGGGGGTDTLIFIKK